MTKYNIEHKNISLKNIANELNKLNESIKELIEIMKGKENPPPDFFFDGE